MIKNIASFLTLFPLLLVLMLVLTGCDPGGELTVPEQPNIMANGRNQSVELQWENIEGAEYYLVYYTDSSTLDKDKLTPIKSSQRNVVIENLENNRPYFLTVTAVGSGGESDIINTLAVTPKPPPAPPQEISVATGSESLTISWSEIDSAKQYNIYIARSPGMTLENYQTLSGWIKLENVKSPHTQTGLTNGQTHFVAVTSVSNSGESKISGEIETMPTQTLKLAMGRYHNCAILIDNTLWCWGRNNMGQLGDGSFENRSLPVNIAESYAWKDVSLGPFHSCALTVDEDLWCWGYNSNNQITSGLPSKLSQPVKINGDQKKYKSISISQDFGCGIVRDELNPFDCWGNEKLFPSFENIEFGSSKIENKDWSKLFIGEIESCAQKKDKTLWCWRHAKSELPDIELYEVESENFWSTVSLGSDYNCMLSANGKISCNDNEYYYINFLSYFDYNKGQYFNATDNNWNDIAVSNDHICGLSTDSALICWGFTYFSENSRLFKSDPVFPETTEINANWKNVYASNDNNCAIKLDGSIWCAGPNTFGQLGSGEHAFEAEPVAVLTDVYQFSVNKTNVCALEDNKTNNINIYCWGANEVGQVGNGTKVNQQLPVAINAQNAFYLTTSSQNSCFIAWDSSLECWGLFEYMFENPLLSPVKWGDEIGWALVALGDINRCGIKEDRSLWCVSDFLEIEEAIKANKVSFLKFKYMEPFESENDWQIISMRANHACAVDFASQLWCWGINEYGELGMDNSENYRLPEKIKMDIKWRDVVVAETHSCGIDLDDDLWCWGNNEFGQLGNGSMNDSNQPEPVSSDIGWQQVQVSNKRTCGVKQDHTLWCWGASLATSVEQESEVNAKIKTPKKVNNRTNWQAVGIGDRFLCATNQENVFYCWGDNTQGVIGNGKAWSTEWKKVKFPISNVILQ